MIKDDLVGQKFIINNTSATNQLRIYPATTEIINGQPAGDPYVLGAGMAAQIISSSLTSWNTRNTTTTLPASLISISSLATSGNEMLYTVASNTYATSIISAAGRSFMSESSPAGQRAAIGVVIGADVAAYSPNLTSLATIGGLPANNMVYTTGSGYANSTISPYARSLLANTTATSMRGGIGLSYLPDDTNSGYNLSSDVVVGMSAAQTLHNKTIGADNNVVIGANTSFNGLPFSTVAIPANGDVLRVVGGALELSAVNYGDVYGPASATSGALAVFGDSSGKLLANSSITLTGANLAGIGTLAATTVNSTTVNATTLGGTLSTAAQPNVTSVGSLSSLAVVGSANMGGVVTFNGNAVVPTTRTLTIVDAPLTSTSAANKAYVDLVASTGAAPLVACTGATTTVLPNTPTYSSAAGTLTATGSVIILVVDGITYTALSGQRLLVKNQVDPRQNGVYVRSANVGGNWVLTRATDFDTPIEALQNTSTLVLGGTININSTWSLQTAVTQFNPQLATPGGSDVNWIQISASQNLTAGSGLMQSGNTFNVVGTTDRVVVGASVDIAANYVGQSSITTLGTIATGIWNGTVISPAYGGSGLTSPTANRVLVSNGSAAYTLKTNPTSDFVGVSDAQTITNKIMGTGRINTTGVVFANDNVTTSTLSLDTSGLSAARTLVVPDSSDTLALVGTPQSFTEKTLTSNTNNVIARSLWANSGAGFVSTYASALPTAGQVLTAIGANTATWQTPTISPAFAPSRALFVYLGAANVAPNFSTFTSALAYAVTQTPTVSNPMLICVYPGLYTEVNPITVPPYVTITSMTSSPSSVLLRPASPAVVAPMLITTGNARLMGFIISGRDAAGGYATIGIQSSGSASQVDLFTFMTVRNVSLSCYSVAGNGVRNSHLMVTKGCTAQNTVVGTTIINGFECRAGASLGGVDTIITGVYTAGTTGEITNGLYAYNDATIADINVVHITYCTNAMRVGGSTTSNSQTEYPTLRVGAGFISNISSCVVLMDDKSTCVLGDVKTEDSSGFFPNQRHLVINNPALPAEPNLLMMLSVVARSDKVAFQGAANNPVRLYGYGISDVPGEAQNRFQGEVSVGSTVAPSEMCVGEGDAHITGLVAFLSNASTFTNVTTALSSPERSPIAVDLATTAAINLTSAPSTIDGATPTTGVTRVLVMFGSTATPGAVSTANGVYIWNGAGAAMTRASDFAAGSKRTHNTWFNVDVGTVNYGSIWKISESSLVGVDTITVGTTAWGVRAQSSRVFQTSTNDDALYIGNSTLAKFPGVLLGVVKPITLASGTTPAALTWEYWNGSAWTSLRFMATLADAPYTNHGDSSFAIGLPVINPGVIRLNYRFGDTATWATNTVNGTLAYWVRVRCINASLITRIPTITRVKFHSNYFRIGTDGYNEYFGTSRYRIDEKMNWFDTGISGGTITATRVIATALPTTISLTGQLNTFLAPTLRSCVTVWRPTQYLDSSAPLVVKINGSIGNATGGNIVFTINYAFLRDGDVMPNVTGTATAVGKTQIVSIVAAPNVARAAFSTTISVDITGIIPTNLLWLKLSRNGAAAADTFASDVYLHHMAFSTLRWSNGEYSA